jgi:hypothetical protein
MGAVALCKRTEIDTRRMFPDENILSFTLQQAGINRKLSSRAQQIADVPEEARIAPESLKKIAIYRSLISQNRDL